MSASRSTVTACVAAPSTCSPIPISALPSLPGSGPRQEQVKIDAGYAVYLERQRADVAAFRRDEDLHIPDDFDFDSVTGFSNETRQKFRSIRPRTVGQAGRIDGITPAATTLLLAALRKHRLRRSAGAEN